jgi:rhodanese-related sulfurtransferase
MQTISAEEVQQRIAAGEQINLLDVREPHEHTEFNIGGILLPLGHVQTMQIDELDEWKEKEIICYCRSGNRSGQASLLLETFGFTNVKNLVGGMLGWKEKFGG